MFRTKGTRHFPFAKATTVLFVTAILLWPVHSGSLPVGVGFRPLSNLRLLRTRLMHVYSSLVSSKPFPT